MDVLAYLEDASRDVEGILTRAGLLAPPAPGSSPLHVQTYLQAVEGMRQAKVTAARNISRQKLSGSSRGPTAFPSKQPVKSAVVPRPPSIIAKLHVVRRGSALVQPSMSAEVETPAKPKAANPSKRVDKKKPFAVPTKLFAEVRAAAPHRITPNPRLRATDTFPLELRNIHTSPIEISGPHAMKRVTPIPYEDYRKPGSLTRYPTSGGVDRSFEPMLLPVRVPIQTASAPMLSASSSASNASSQPIHVHINMPKTAPPQEGLPQEPAVMMPIMISSKQATPPPLSVPIFIQQTRRPIQAPPPVPVVVQQDSSATALSVALQSMWRDVMGVLGDTLGTLKAKPEASFAAQPPPVPMGPAQMSNDVLLEILATTCMKAEQERGTRNTESLRQLIEDVQRRVGMLQSDVQILRSTTDACLDFDVKADEKLDAILRIGQVTHSTVQAVDERVRDTTEALAEQVADNTAKIASELRDIGSTLAGAIHDLGEETANNIETAYRSVEKTTSDLIHDDVVPALGVLADEIAKLNREPSITNNVVDMSSPLMALQTNIVNHVNTGLSGVASKQISMDDLLENIAQDVKELRNELKAFQTPEPAPPAPSVPQEESVTSEESEESEGSISMGQVQLASPVHAGYMNPRAYVAVPYRPSAEVGVIHGLSSSFLRTRSTARQQQPQVSQASTPNMEGGDMTESVVELPDWNELEELPYLHEVEVEDLSSGEVVLPEDLSVGELLQVLPLHNAGSYS